MLSTLHTNSAAGAISRLLSMAVAPYLLAPALNCVMGQRLVRRVCPSCRKKIVLTELDESLRNRTKAVMEHLNEADKKRVQSENQEFYTASKEGCTACNGIGYKGRIGICEMFVVSDEIKQLILASSVGEAGIEELARAHGMRTMVEDGLLKAIEGVTTLDEVFRVIE
jgi:type II secretory ATPase GspE/PulE/Tfp pilus assembly ATPase PilB-like protein